MAEKGETKILTIITIFIILFSILFSGCIGDGGEDEKNDQEITKMPISGIHIPSFSLSRDEKFMVYCKSISGEKDYNTINEIWIYNFETNVNQKVCQCNNVRCNPIFNVDHSKIIFLEDENISQVNVNGNNKQKLTTDGAEYFVFNRDYTKIVFEKYGPIKTISLWGDNESGSVSTIWIMESDGSNQRQLTNFSYPFDPYIVDISPDNSKIMFSVFSHLHPIERRRSSFDEIEDMHGIWEINIDGTNMNRIIDGEKSAIEYSHNGSKISFHTEFYYHHKYIWIMDANGSDIIELSPSKDFQYYYGEVYFHPNNEDILYAVSINDYETNSFINEIWLIDYYGNNPRKIHTVSEGDIYQVSFLNEGEKILILTNNPETMMDEINLIVLNNMN